MGFFDWLLGRLQGIQTRTARFVCVIALVRGGRLVKTFRGTVEGRIIDHPRGPEGFGYDPLFYFPLIQKTFAELTAAEKSLYSHRGKAFAASISRNSPSVSTTLTHSFGNCLLSSRRINTMSHSSSTESP
jgi:non-canonical purine NTP pyrophosphatase (RdgB/HAM1 family)